eukprot:SAG31_NODE_9540_length_1260_cov_41.894057_1_plen_33_part_10
MERFFWGMGGGRDSLQRNGGMYSPIPTPGGMGE